MVVRRGINTLGLQAAFKLLRVSLLILLFQCHISEVMGTARENLGVSIVFKHC